MIPFVNKENFEVTPFREGLMVRDLRNDKSMCLSRLTAFVFQLCDGEKSPWDIQKRASEEIDSTIDENVIWTALTQLETLGLIEPEDDSIGRYKAYLTTEKTRFELVPAIALMN
ncbi:MAG: hypothetical protein ACK5NT_01030 [Pyrinomonadaceae bacterium]